MVKACCYNAFMCIPFKYNVGKKQGLSLARANEVLIAVNKENANSLALSVFDDTMLCILYQTIVH